MSDEKLIGSTYCPAVVDYAGVRDAFRRVERVGAWSWLSPRLLDDDDVLNALAGDLLDECVEQAYWQALEVTGPTDVQITHDGHGFIQNRLVMLVEVECLELPHRVARSRVRRGRRWVADRARRIRRVFEP